MATILVVDDEATNRLLIRSILTLHDVREAEGAESAFAQLRASTPDLIILDVAMPVMNGFEFLKRLRTEMACEARVLLYTATRPDDTMRDIASTYRVSGFLPKPCDPRETIRIVEEALA